MKISNGSSSKVCNFLIIRGSFGKSWNSHDISERHAQIFINRTCTESYIFPLEHGIQNSCADANSHVQIRGISSKGFAIDQIFDKFSSYGSRGAKAYIKIRTLLGATPTDINADLDTVYGSQAASYITITRCFLQFKQGRESLEDDPRSGCPLSAFSEKWRQCCQTSARWGRSLYSGWDFWVIEL